MKKKATKRPAKASGRQSTLNFPTSSEADLVAESAAAETSTKSGAKNRRKRTADCADDADKHNKAQCDSFAISAVKTQTRRSTESMPADPTELPKPWHWGTLGDILRSIDTGKSFRCEERPPQSDETGVIKVSAVTWGTYDESESKTCVDASRINEQYLVNQGDFLFSRANTIQLIGACVIADNVTRRMMLSDKILRFRFKSDILPKWVLYWLRSTRGHREIERLSTGNQESMRNIGQDRIRQIQIPLAPLPEQHRIVAEIEKQFTRLDAGVAALKRVKANLKRYRAAVLKAACEGKLVPTEAELARQEGRTYETGEQLLQRILTERRDTWQGRKQYKEPTNPDAANLPPLPAGWKWGTFDQITTLITKGSSPNWQGFDYCDQGIMFVRSENVRWGTLNLQGVAYLPPEFNEKETKSVLREGDVLLNLVGASIGRAAIATDEVEGGNVNQAVAVIRLVSKKTMNQFAMLWLNSSNAQKRIHENKVDVARANFGLDDTRVLPIPLPPFAEQTRIVAEVERRLSVVDELESVVSANLQRATRLRQSILQKVFTGDLLHRDDIL